MRKRRFIPTQKPCKDCEMFRTVFGWEPRKEPHKHCSECGAPLALDEECICNTGEEDVNR